MGVAGGGGGGEWGHHGHIGICTSPTMNLLVDVNFQNLFVVVSVGWRGGVGGGVRVVHV